MSWYSYHLHFNCKQTYSNASGRAGKINSVDQVNGPTQGAQFNELFFRRVMWVIVILLGLIGAGIMVCTLWADYVDDPIITSVDTNYYPTWRLPFPALTLCNVNHIFRSKAEVLVSKLWVPLPLLSQHSIVSADDGFHVTVFSTSRCREPKISTLGRQYTNTKNW